MKLTSFLVAAVFVLASSVGCSSPTLIQEVSAAATVVATISDPGIANYLSLANDAVQCATATGTQQQVIDGCLSTALQNYRLAWTSATPAEQELITIVVTAIEGYINDTTSAPASQKVMARAKAQVKNPVATTPTAKQFKTQFNTAAKKAGAKPI
jgi:hypothetical protein